MIRPRPCWRHGATMLTIEWTLPAIADLQAAGDYIAQHNTSAASQMATRVIESVELLAEHPNLGRPGMVDDTRELVIGSTPFIAVYWVRRNKIQILRLLHHARQWPVEE